MDQPTSTVVIDQKYEAVIFDFDGTIVDLGTDWTGLKQELHDVILEKYGKEFVFTPLDPTVQKVRDELGEEVYKDLLTTISKYEQQEERYTIITKLLDYINNGLNRPYAIYSMNTESTIRRFIEKHFKTQPDYIIGKETCDGPKPRASDIAKIISKWGIDDSKVVMVGNSDYDKGSAELAKIDFLWIQDL